MALLALLLLLASEGIASASEVDCPLHYPGDSANRLVGAEPQMDGANIGHPPDIDERKGDVRHYANIYEEWDTRKGGVVCRYNKGEELTFQVTGLLVRCDWLQRVGPNGKIMERIWCTGRE